MLSVWERDAKCWLQIEPAAAAERITLSPSPFLIFRHILIAIAESSAVAREATARDDVPARQTKDTSRQWLCRVSQSVSLTAYTVVFSVLLGCASKLALGRKGVSEEVSEATLTGKYACINNRRTLSDLLDLVSDTHIHILTFTQTALTFARLLLNIYCHCRLPNDCGCGCCCRSTLSQLCLSIPLLKVENERRQAYSESAITDTVAFCIMKRRVCVCLCV